jgi:O-antigen/teichoic acid export membrane protein
MNKALKMAKASATGSLKLSLGLVTSSVIMAVGTIILGRLLSPEEYGLYSIALIPSLMFALFRDFGVNSAMTKYIAQFRASNKDENAHDIIVAGLAFEIVTGLTLSFISLFMANFIASTIFRRPESTSLISIVSISIFSTALLIVPQSSFIGFERMGLNSFTMIFQSIAKTAISILLVFLGYGALGAVIGYTFSILATGIIGLLMLYLVVFRSFRTKTNRSGIIKSLKTMLRYGIPLSISTIIAGFLTQFYGFMMAFFCSDLLIGNYHITVNFSVILAFFITPVSTVLFPAFAKLDPQNEQKLLKTVFASSAKYTALLLVPATMAMMILSQPMIYTLFGVIWVYAPLFLTLYVARNLFAALGSLSANSLFIGLGETKMPMKQSVLTLVLGIPLAALLIPTFGILGVIVGTLLAEIPSLFWGLYWIWKHYKVKVDFRSSARIFVASAIAAITTYLSLNFLATAELIRLMVGGIIFLGVYLVATPVIGAVNQTDINNLRAMFSGLGIISKLMNIPLSVVEKIAKTHRASNKSFEEPMQSRLKK